jgi:hypothetical protein
MKFEDAMNYLRLGYRIYRTSDPEKGSLCGTAEKPMGSFYLTLWDVLADDWDFVARDVFHTIDDEGDVIENCKIILKDSIEFLNLIESVDEATKLNVRVSQALINQVIKRLGKNLGPKNEQ